MLETFKDAVSGAFSRVSSLFTTPNANQTSKRKRQENTTREEYSFAESPSKKLRVHLRGRNMPVVKPKPTIFASEAGSSQHANSALKLETSPSREPNEGRQQNRTEFVIMSQPVSVSSSVVGSKSSQTSPRSSLLPPSKAVLPVHSPVPRYCLEYYKSCSQPTGRMADKARKTGTNSLPKIKMSLIEQLGLSQGRQLSSGSSVTSSASCTSTINHCIRLKEKESYSRLLEQFTCRAFSFGGSTSAAIIHETRIEPVPQSKSPIIVEITSVTHTSTAEESLRDQTTTQGSQFPESTTSSATAANTDREVPGESSQAESVGLSPVLNPAFASSLRKRFSAKERERQRLVENECLQKKLGSKLRDDFETALEDTFRKQISLIAEVSEVPVTLPKITKEMEEIIRNSLQRGPLTVVCKAFDADITGQDLVSLRGLNWLNDQIINTYFTMIMQRSKTMPQFPRSYAFNTFFYPKLVSSGHAGLKRWTRKVDIFSYDLLLVPLHLGLHWCTAVISVKDKIIYYYDSLGGNNKHCLNALLQYLADESLDKKKVPLDVNQWTTKCVKGVPQQSNGSDCGVFCCKFAEYASRGAKFTFSQKDMPYYRRRMVYEIVKQDLLFP